MNYTRFEADENHEFALSASYGGIIHITKVVESGRHDFTCLGCGKPMQAILRKIHGPKPYFRHDVQEVPAAQRCTFSNAQYRKKIALDTLQIEKRLELPPLYKLPPKGVEGLAIPLFPKQLLEFTEMKRQQNICEKPDGSIDFRAGPTEENEELLISVDAVCYDENGEPVLLVLISDGKRRKMDVQQMAVLAKLRINTIVITPAKSSAEDIHTGVLTGKNTKWLYNDDERQFDYLSLSADLAGAIPTADVDQGQLFEETFDCRKVEINNLIRVINKFLGTEPYRAAEEYNRRIIGETEFAIARAGERRDEFEERYSIESNAKYRDELDRIVERRERLKRDKGEFERTAQNLEERYFSKRREIEQAARGVEADIHAAQFLAIGGGKPIAARRREIEQRVERARDRMDERYNGELQSIGSQRRTIERAIVSERNAVERLRSLIEKEPGRLDGLLAAKATEFDEAENNERTRIEQIQTDGTNLPERFGREAETLRAEFEELRNAAAIAAETGDAEGISGLSRRLKALLDGRGLLVAIADAQSDLRKHRAAKEFLESSAGQIWLRSHRP